jgi:hypothetical protein
MKHIYILLTDRKHISSIIALNEKGFLLICTRIVWSVVWLSLSLIKVTHGSPSWLGWPLWNICVTNDHGYVPLVVNTSRSFPHSRLITGFVTRLTRRVPLVEQELPTLPEHLSSPPVFSGVRVTRSLVLYVWFVNRCLSFCTFSFGHCVLCSSSIYGLWLPLWYLQTLLAWKLYSFPNVNAPITHVNAIGHINAFIKWTLFAYAYIKFSTQNICQATNFKK